MKNSTFFRRHLNKACEKNTEKLDLFQYFVSHILPDYQSSIPTIEHMYGNPQDVTQDEITPANNFGLANLFSEHGHASTSYSVMGFEIETTRIDESICETDVQNVSKNVGLEESCTEPTLNGSSGPSGNSTDANILPIASKPCSNTIAQIGLSSKDNLPN